MDVITQMSPYPYLGFVFLLNFYLPQSIIVYVYLIYVYSLYCFGHCFPVK
jgi:hypothetical protein